MCVVGYSNICMYKIYIYVCVCACACLCVCVCPCLGHCGCIDVSHQWVQLFMHI